MRFVDAVVRPDAFFEQEFPDGRLGVAAALLVVYALGFVAALFLIGQVIAGAAGLGPSETGALQGLLLFSGILTGVFFAVFAVVLAALYYLGTALAGGSGSFGDTFVVTAWGLVPSLVGAVLGAVVFAVTFDPGSVTGSPEAVSGRVQGYQSSPLVQVVNLVVTLWQIYVVSYGLKHARNVSIQAGAAVATAVTLLFLAFRVL